MLDTVGNGEKHILIQQDGGTFGRCFRLANVVDRGEVGLALPVGVRPLVADRLEVSGCSRRDGWLLLLSSGQGGHGEEEHEKRHNEDSRSGRHVWNDVKSPRVDANQSTESSGVKRSTLGVRNKDKQRR